MFSTRVVLRSMKVAVLMLTHIQGVCNVAAGTFNNGVIEFAALVNTRACGNKFLCNAQSAARGCRVINNCR